MGLTPQAAMAATASCMLLSGSYESVVSLVMRYVFTINVAMLSIHGNPIVSTTRDSPAMICSRQHLPRTEGPARRGPEGLL